MTEFLLSCAPRLWPPSESDLGNGAQREQQPQLTLFVKLKCLSKAIFFTSILNLWRISYIFLKVFQLVTWVLQAVCGCFCWREVTRHSLNLSARLALWDKLTPLRGKSSATYPTQLKTHALSSAVCMCKHEQERTRMHRCYFPCWRHWHSPFACPCHLHHHLWPTRFQVLL